MNTQPEALRLADALEGDDSYDNQAAAELRRLHALNQELLEALKALMCDHGGSRAVSSDDDRAIKARAAIAKAGENK